MVCRSTRSAVIVWAGFLEIAAGLVLQKLNQTPFQEGVPWQKISPQPVPIIPSGQVQSFNGGVINSVVRATIDTEVKDPSHKCLDGKRIVFIGSSTSKADYLALAYFAEYGRWPDKDMVVYGAGSDQRAGPNPLYGPMMEQESHVGGRSQSRQSIYPCNVGSAESYLWYSNSIFNNHELCDCYKNDPHGSVPNMADIYNQTENRIYGNGKTMIAYFQWFKDTVNPRGSVDLAPLTYLPTANGIARSVHQQCPVGQFKGKWDWSIPVGHFMANFVRNVKPTHLIVDAEYVSANSQNTQFWDELSSVGVNAVALSRGEVLWRTAPTRRDYLTKDTSNGAHLQMFKDKGWQIFDARGIVQMYRGNTGDSDIFFDPTHLKPAAESHLMSSFLHTHVCPVHP